MPTTIIASTTTTTTTAAVAVDEEPWSAADALAPLRDALQTSSLLQYVRACEEMHTSALVTPLSLDEVAQLERQGNTAEDWGQVFKTTAAVNTARIRSCAFQGRVVLGAFADGFAHELEGGVRFPSGCYRTTLRNAVVLDDALVQDTLLLNNVYVAARAVVVGCGPVVFKRTQSADADADAARQIFGNGMTLHVGVETGGRSIRAVADLPFALAAAVAGRRADTAFLEAYDALVDAFVARIAACECTIVASDARLVQCARVESSFVGECAVLEDAEVVDATVLSSREEPSAVLSKSSVRHAVVQWHCVVEGMSIVRDAFLCDCAHVERQGIVLSSVIGPNTSVAEGEVTSSFVGPFVGFHHHALLIAAYWPSGKGNVGYGANVGSNHTLKAPDQELFPGEGVFFGLGTNVKFPSNFVRAPYAVLATGVTTLPQRLAMPFALVNTPGHVIPTLSPAINEISPGWVLAHSVFTVLRNEHKFATRNKSMRTRVAAAIFRPDVVQCMKDARAQLVAAIGTATLAVPETREPVFTDKQVPGLGKNYMRESARVDGVAAYSFFIQLYALTALLEHVESGRVAADATVGAIRSAAYDLATLKEEFAANTLVRDCLRDLVAKRAAVAANAARGKARDDARGKRIIPDYELVHKPVGDEAIVVLAKRAAADVKTRVARFVTRM